jgi:hypothetical protein
MSDGPTSTPNPNAARTEAQRDFYPLKLLGIEIPLPHWAYPLSPWSRLSPFQ